MPATQSDDLSPDTLETPVVDDPAMASDAEASGAARAPGAEPTSADPGPEPQAEPQAQDDAPWEAEAGAEEPAPAPQPSLVDILRGRLQERDDQLHTYIGAYKQAKEEMEKARERMKRDQAKQVARAKMNAARDLLEVLDNLDRTLHGVPDEGPAANLAAGVRMVHKQFLGVLEGFGVERMNALGTTFDPKIHEAVGMVPAPPGKADQEILFVQRAGYLFQGQLLRAAQVIVAAAS